MAQNTALATIAADDQQEAQASALAKRLKGPQFPDNATPEQALEVARVAVAYGLDPFLGELMPYKGRPYITFDGRVRIADRHPAYDGYDLEPASELEIKALRATPESSVWKCTVYRKDRSRPTVAYGKAGGQGEQNKNIDVALLAQKRAIHRALRAAFPVPIPGLEESLTGDQLRAIHAYDSDAGVSPDERRATLVDTFGVEHSNELTTAQASAYLDERAIEVDSDGVIVDDFEEPTDAQMKRDLEYIRGLVDAAHTGKELGTAWSKAFELFGEDPDVLAMFSARKAEILEAKTAGK